MPTSHTDYRAELERLMRATLADEDARHTWTYHAVRPCPMPSRPWHPGERVTGDCSKGVEFLCWWADLPVDPMFQGWGAYGNSQTLWRHLQHLDHPGQLLVGDVVTFGRDGNEHAAMVLEQGGDPLLWSFGHQGAPNAYRLSEDRRPQQYLRMPVPTFVPTPQDKLRAKSGWFAWMNWYDGTGDWKTYGARNKNVRPSVPKVISLAWWARRAKFKANQKKGNSVGTKKLAL